MTINDRIKYLRKDVLKMNQTDFANAIGLKQRGASYLEQDGCTVTEQNIKIICSQFNVNEAWLRTGFGEMFIEEGDPISIEEFVKAHGGGDLEVQILTSYFRLDPDIRQKVLEAFFTHNTPPENSEPKIQVYCAARSDADVPAGNIEMSASDLEKLHTATPITSDDDI